MALITVVAQGNVCYLLDVPGNQVSFDCSHL